MSNVKQVIVLRTDLNMRKGKMVVQGCHASMKVFFDRITHIDSTTHIGNVTEDMIEWINGSFTKICVGIGSEDELLKLFARAAVSGLPYTIIQDSGLTEFGGVPTYTAVAIGPAKSEEVDKLTGDLKLL